MTAEIDFSFSGQLVTRSPMKGILVSTLLSVALPTVPANGAEALRDKNSPAGVVRVFKDIDALSRFKKLDQIDPNQIKPMLACEAPQGSKIRVFGAGYETAFVGVEEGSAKGCRCRY
jgi:hypothetical protein